MPRATILIAVLAFAAAPARADTYPRQPGVDALHYAFRLTLGDETDEIAGEATASLEFLAGGVTEVFLDLASGSSRRGSMALFLEAFQIKCSAMLPSH